MDINNPFETFQKYAFRLEALPRYLVENEKEAFAAFKESGVLPDSFGLDWSELVSNNVRVGKKMQRLRLLSEHLTDYERFELQIYSGPSQGEQIHTGMRNDYQDQYMYDFWFFDDKWIAQVNYEDDGTFINFDIRLATPQELQMYTYWYAVYKVAKPLKHVSSYLK